MWEDSKAYCGAAFLSKEELKESNIDYKIELEYYKTKNYELQNNTSFYGIEIIKKEYKNDGINIESNNVKNISDSSEKVIQIIEKLKKHNVTPIGLNDVLEDLIKAK